MKNQKTKAKNSKRQRGLRPATCSASWSNGYFCAVAAYVGSHGRNTGIDEVFRAGGNPELADELDKRIFRENGMMPNKHI